MGIFIPILIGLPSVAAILLAIFKNDTIRKIVTYISSAAIICTAIVFTITYFTKGAAPVAIAVNNEIINYAMMAGEVFLMCLVTILSIKYKKIWISLLSIIQTVAILIYELGGFAPEVELCEIYIDSLTVIMVLIVGIVGTLITVYACGYMKDYVHHHTDVKDRRRYFFSLMYVFLAAMFGLVMSNGFVWMYFFWEITSVISFLLIGYTKTQEAINNCFKALWMNLLGGCGFCAAIIIAGVKYGYADIQNYTSNSAQGVMLSGVTILFAFAALTKSAQLPFSKWLLGAMVAPTPSSTLLHSATMVKAGVYLLIRLAPVLGIYNSGTGFNPAGTMVAFIGGFTFLICSMLAITVSDGKSVLAYSTISNLGLMCACAGVGTAEAVWSAVFLLIFHAISKSLMFQTVGVIENATGSRDIDSMHGLIRRQPMLALTLVTGIAGMYLAPFGMLIAKWSALKSFIDNSSVILVIFICFGSATTLLYWSKWMATVLASNPNDKKQKNTTHKNSWVSMIIHTILMIAVCFGFIIISNELVVPFIQNSYQNSFDVIAKENIIIMIIMIAAIIIIPFAAWLSIKDTPYIKANRYINGINTGDNETFTDSFGSTKKVTLSNWYLEEIFGESKIYKPCAVLAIVAVGVLIVVALGGMIL